MKNSPDDPLYRLSQMYPGLSENELEEIKEILEGYAEIALRVLDRISKDPAAYADFDANVKKIKEQKKRGK